MQFPATEVTELQQLSGEKSYGELGRTIMVKYSAWICQQF